MTKNTELKKAKTKAKPKSKIAAIRPDAVKVSTDAKAIILEKALEMSVERGRITNLREAIDEIVIEWKTGLKPDEYRKQQQK